MITKPLSQAIFLFWRWFVGSASLFYMAVSGAVVLFFFTVKELIRVYTHKDSVVDTDNIGRNVILFRRKRRN